MDSNQSDISNADPHEDLAASPAGDAGDAERMQDGGGLERRLRRDLARAREQTRAALAERDAVVNSLQAESNDRLIRSELQVRALQHGILDLDALRLLDTGSIAIGADGLVAGADEALEQFRSSKPYLFDQNRQLARHVTTSAIQRPPQRAEPEPVDARQLSREQWQAERARLLSRPRGS